LEEWEAADASDVGRGVSLWIAVQSLSQLETVYGKARSQVLRDNMESQLYYRPTDLATAIYLEKLLGDTSAYAHSTTSRESGTLSEGLAERPIPLLMAQEILQLPDTQVIGFHLHLPPFRLTRMDWRTQPLLQHRTNTPVPQLPTLPSVADIPKHNREQLEQALIDPDLIHQAREQVVDRLN
jgi:type IV secretion system protein VirD4